MPNIHQSEMKILIIGAGIAGISAATNIIKKCQANPPEITILEARDRVGGRAWTKYFGNVPIDLGASWIDGIDENPLTDIAMRQNFKLIHDGEDLLHDAKIFYQGKIVPSNYFHKRKSEFFEHVAACVKNLSSDISIKAGLVQYWKDEKIDWSADLDQKIFQFLLRWIAGYTGARPSEISLGQFSWSTGFTGECVGIQQGFGQMIENEAKGLHVEYYQHVLKVDDRNNQVFVTCKSGKVFSADYLICTIPIGCLQRNTIEFNPPLPTSKKQAIDSIGMGCYTKVILEFEKIWWKDVFWVDLDSKFHFYMFQDHYFENAPYMVCCISGEFGYEVEKMPRDEIINLIMKHLTTSFQNVPKPKSSYVTRWGGSNLSYGSYTYYKVGTKEKHFDIVGEPLTERIFFAGEGSISRGASFANGAILSGLREADRIQKIWSSIKSRL
jgi:monoamine oxidase